ncbi:hypothetical protein [Xanthobacter flavus]|uniref:hypothetical protein n=1 Tax=Xanthobacter flavus TaxID=281 RepID=UPI001AE110BE|nr:hypothetical protein [Xanthobacter flavus]MBP2151636.1 hypothetical protein [Xanthobacter flavus]
MVVFALAAASGLWLVVVSPSLDIQATYDLNLAAKQMLNGESFPPEILDGIAAKSAPVLEAQPCNFLGFQDLAIIRSAQLENAIVANDSNAADRLSSQASDAAKKSLVCNPMSVVSWTILAWVEFLQNDDTPRLRSLLDMSFRAGPFEGWSLLRRVELQLHILPTLDNSSIEQLKRQINWLIARGLVEVPAQLYLSAGPQQQAYLRNLLAESPEEVQKRAEQIVWNSGGNIALPLARQRGSRPWN